MRHNHSISRIRNQWTPSPLLTIVVGIVIVAGSILAEGQQKPVPAAAPIAVTAAEATLIRDAANAAQIADLQFQNALKDAKINHAVPPAYIYDFNTNAFVAPPQRPAAAPITTPPPQEKPTP
jgi:hypothetical protein